MAHAVVAWRVLECLCIKLSGGYICGFLSDSVLSPVVAICDHICINQAYGTFYEF